MRANYHTHTSRCRHARGAEEDYIASALRSRLAVLGFSDHAPFPGEDFGFRMPYGELRDYLDTLDGLREKYAADLIILKGLEIEYLPEYTGYYEELLTKSGLDYLLLGQHFYRTGDGKLHYTADISDTVSCIGYARSVAEAMQTGYFKMVAHPDLFMMNFIPWEQNCEKAADLILDAAVRTNTVLEYNANGFRREKKEYPDGLRYQYPYAPFWRRAASAKIPVMVGSDCHEPSQVWDDAVEYAYEQLKGFDISFTHPLHVADSCMGKKALKYACEPENDILI